MMLSRTAGSHLMTGCVCHVSLLGSQEAATTRPTPFTVELFPGKRRFSAFSRE